ncbi:hypothetical protein AB9P05_08675 [Roseivirga sp. BDSF3-8]|uniref:hypothetical protein n=1 Tax=Roseivirga sp. BDSF3-8 TaxID=3241598 RepID=UPI003531D2C3
MGKNADSFKQFDKIVFESVEKIDDVTGSVIRRIDVKTTKGVKDFFFEFKTVQPPLPPKGFADQFVKDLKLTDVTSLDQLKWVFDGKKVSSLTKSDFMEVLENANISDEEARKLVKNIDNPTADDLLDLIEANFDEIFQVK